MLLGVSVQAKLGHHTKLLESYNYYQYCLLPCLFVCLIWGITLFFLIALLPILAVCKMGEVAATVPAMSDTDMLLVIHGW